jgi:hypothetical protein
VTGKNASAETTPVTGAALGIAPASYFFHFYKGIKMNSNQKDDQGNKQSGTQGSSGGAPGSRSGSQGGTHEQHVEAGRQSHKNDDGSATSKQSGGATSKQSSGAGSKQSNPGVARSGTSEQQNQNPRQDKKG